MGRGKRAETLRDKAPTAVDWEVQPHRVLSMGSRYKASSKFSRAGEGCGEEQGSDGNLIAGPRKTHAGNAKVSL